MDDTDPAILRYSEFGFSETGVANLINVALWLAFVFAGVNKCRHSDHLHQYGCACGRTNTDEDAHDDSARVSAKDAEGFILDTFEFINI